jgi:cytochrome c oxidase cbb3-type subunit III
MKNRYSGSLNMYATSVDAWRRPKSLLKARSTYQQNCAACHGADGEGNKQLGAPNLTNDIWLYGGSQKDVIESVRDGREGQDASPRGIPR